MRRNLPWVLAGRDPEDLRAQARALRARVAAASPGRLAELAAATAAEAEPLAQRAVVFACDGEEALRELDRLAGGAAGPRTIRGEGRVGTRVAFVFSPLRSEYRGAALGLLPRYPFFAARMAAHEEAFESLLDWSLGDLLRERKGAPPFQRLDVGPPLLFALSAALAELWRAFGVNPDGVLGHSVGEIAAAVTCGALSQDDGARVATAWGRSARRLEGTGAMASLPLSAAETEARLERWRDQVAISAFNAPKRTAVSGEIGAVEELLEELAGEGIKGRSMGIGVPGHSEGMAPIDAGLRQELATISPRPSAVPFCSATEGRVIDSNSLDAGYWSHNLRQPVRFEAAVRSLREAGFDTFLEIGPRPILTGSIGEVLAGEGNATAIGNREQGEGSQFHLQLAEAHVLGIDVDWGPFYRDRLLAEPTPAADPLLTQRLTELSERRQDQLLLDLVRREAATVLGHDSPGDIDPVRPFKDLGFDSRAAVDLRNGLNRATGLDLSATLVFDHPTPRAVAKKLRDELGGQTRRPPRETEPDPVAERALHEIDELDLAGLVELGLGGDDTEAAPQD